MTDQNSVARAYFPDHAGEDPLDELARIVSGQSEHKFPSAAARAPAAPAPPQREPVFDLEDALMRELGFDAANQSQPVAAAAPVGVPAATLSLEEQLLAELGVIEPQVMPARTHAVQPRQEQLVEAPGYYAEPGHRVPANSGHDAFGSGLSHELFAGEQDFDQQDEPLHDGPLHDGPLHDGPLADDQMDEFSQGRDVANDASFGVDFGSALEDEISRTHVAAQEIRNAAPALAAAAHPAAYHQPMRSLATPVALDNRAVGVPARRQQVTERELEDHFASAFAEELDLGLANLDPADAFDAGDGRQEQDTNAAHDDFAAQATAGHGLLKQPHSYSDPVAGGDDGNWELDPGFAGEDEIDPQYAKGSALGRSRNGFALAAIALTFAIVLGGGALAFGFLSGPVPTGDPVIVKADASPVKVKPENPGGTKIENQDQAVYDKVAGAPKDGEAQQSLVSASEKPVDMAALSQTAPVAANPEAKAEERLAPSEEGNTPAIPALAPRKVKTMIIKPDGTVVPAEEPPAQSAAVTTNAADTNVTALVPVQENARDAAGAALVPVDPEAQGVDAVPTRSLKADETAAAAAAEPQEIAPSEPAKAGQPKQAALSSEQQAAGIGGEWAVQLASQRSPEEAQKTFQNLKRKFPSVLDGKALAVQKAEVDGKGVFYRVRVPTQTKQEAVELCERLKAAGGACFPTR